MKVITILATLATFLVTSFVTISAMSSAKSIDKEVLERRNEVVEHLVKMEKINKINSSYCTLILPIEDVSFKRLSLLCPPKDILKDNVYDEEMQNVLNGDVLNIADLISEKLQKNGFEITDKFFSSVSFIVFIFER